MRFKNKLLYQSNLITYEGNIKVIIVTIIIYQIEFILINQEDLIRIESGLSPK